MVRKPDRPKPLGRNVYKIACKAGLAGLVEAPDEAAAAAQFKVPATKLIPRRR